MGTDLTLLVQVYQDGQWVLIKDAKCDSEEATNYQAVPDDELADEEDLMLFHHECDKDYVLFGKLAGVRLGAAFERPLAPRGLPVDVSAEFETCLEAGGDFHHVTHFTLAEIQALDLTDVPTCCTAREYRKSIRSFQRHCQSFQAAFPRSPLRFICCFDS